MVFIILTIISLIGLLSYYIIFSQIKLSSFDLENDDFNEAVSVIICAKNELSKIKRFFPSWINQEYPNFELIIVNDQSTDGSFEYLNELAKAHSNLKVIHIPENETKTLKGKRHALYTGIQQAKNKYLLFTDADCEPASIFWIKNMTKAFINEKIQIVLGYSPYFKENTFLNKLIQYETFLTALQYIGWANAGKPYMSVGRNVAYKKEVFYNEVFENSNKSISGDDDLVFQQIANNENTAYNISENARTYSIAPSTYKNWFLQKKRHLSAGQYYPLKTKLILGLFNLSNLLFILFSSILIINHVTFALAIILTKYLTISALTSNSKLLNTTTLDFLKDFTLIDIIYWLFYLTFAAALTL